MPICAMGGWDTRRAGSPRRGLPTGGFPTPTEKLLLNLATNQATIGLHEAANLIEQRRIASELDREVTRRTNELVKVNEALRKEIADRKRSEEQLRRSEAYLAQAQRLSLTGSFGWSPSSGEIHWSDESFRIFEFDRSIKPTVEFVVQRVHPEDRALVRQAIDETSRGEKDFDLRLRLLMPDGSVKYVHVLSRAVKDAAGKLEVVGALMDVTERHRSELESSRLAAIISSSADAIISKTLDGQITSWNAGATTIFGYEAHEMRSTDHPHHSTRAARGASTDFDAPAARWGVLTLRDGAGCEGWPPCRC
jgi:PAS domain-containing protein